MYRFTYKKVQNRSKTRPAGLKGWMEAGLDPGLGISIKALCVASLLGAVNFLFREIREIRRRAREAQPV